MGKLTTLASGAFGLAKRALRSDSTFVQAGGRTVQAITGSWGDPTRGIGVAGSDPTAQLAYSGGTIPLPQTVSRLYTHDWCAERVIEKMPATSMVRGFELPGEASADQLLKDYRRLNNSDRFPHGAFQSAVYQGRAYGSARLLVGYSLGAPTTALTERQASGGVKFLDVVPQHQIRVVRRHSDAGEPEYGMPELIQVIDDGCGQRHPRTGQVFHTSRSIFFTGKPLRLFDSSALLVEDLSAWHSQPELGVSVLTPVLMSLGRYGLAWSAVSNMLNDKSVGWLKMAGLVEALSQDDNVLVKARMQLMQLTKSIHRLLFLDADNEEEYGRTEINLAEVPQILQQIMLDVSAAAEIPARIFFENPPSALNAGSANESDFTSLYNTCNNYQLTYLGPKLNQVLTAINGGQEIQVKWPTLFEASDNEKAQTRLAKANATKVYWDIGAVEASDVAEAARTDRDPETISTPNDDRAEVTNPGGQEQGEGPQGAPGKDGAADLAAKQRKEESSSRSK